MEVIARKDEMIPHLLAVLESAYAKPVEMLDGPQEMLPTYAAYLLAQFRETRAYQPLIALLNLENDLPYQLFGDSITEEMHNVLACVFDGDEAPLRALIENPAADEYARSSAGRRSYMVLIHAGRISAADVEHYFQDLFDHKLEREPSHVWNNLCSVSADLGFASLLPHIIKAFEGDLCDPFFDRLEHMEERITSGGDARWPRGCEPIDDVVTLKSGYRFCVVYNLVLEEGDLALLNPAPRHASHLALQQGRPLLSAPARVAEKRRGHAAETGSIVKSDLPGNARDGFIENGLPT